MLLDIGTDAFCLNSSGFSFSSPFLPSCGVLLLNTAAVITLIPHKQRLPLCILFQLSQDCGYRGSDVNPFKFERDVSMYWSGLDWLIFGNLRGGLKSQVVGEGLKAAQLIMLTAVCTPSAHSAVCSWELLPHYVFLYFFFPFYEGISLSNEICNLMAIRYGDPDLKISFESFVCFMLRVEIMGGEAGTMCLARQAGLPWPFQRCSSWHGKVRIKGLSFRVDEE